MDPQHSAQDVLRCDLCETPVPPMYCDICFIKLCEPCVGIHISDQSKDHKIVPFEKRGSTTQCPKHSAKICELHCEQCNIPICALCVSSKAHNAHEVVDIFMILTKRKEAIKRDLQELEQFIYTKYQTAASNIPVQKADARIHSQKLTTILKKHGEALHREIDTIQHKIQSDIEDMVSQHLAFIDKQEKAIDHSITEIEQTILDLKKLQETSDFCLLSKYISRNKEFRRLPAQFQVTLPTFTPQDINSEQIYQQIGFLSRLTITAEEHCPMKSSVSSTDSSPLSRPLIDEPRVLIDVNTEYKVGNKLCSVACLNDNELWTSGQDKILRLYNFQGELLNSVQPKSGNWPCDIAVTKSRHLVYTDYFDKSINIIKNTQIQQLVRLRKWLPLRLCSTSSGDLLVSMISEDKKHLTKIVRYSGTIEKQNIQWDDQGRALFSSSINTKYLSENKNSDICVADFTSGEVVVVSAVGKLRFRYIGTLSATKKLFRPAGITTDSQSRILTTDFHNHCIHIIDQDGCFLRYIDNCGLQSPYGLCVDSGDNIFVAELKTGKIKKIQYYK
ncbi:uncharacterized protein LOC111109911 [Crassostrea virginica]